MLEGNTVIDFVYHCVHSDYMHSILLLTTAIHLSFINNNIMQHSVVLFHKHMLSIFNHFLLSVWRGLDCSRLVVTSDQF